MEPTKQELNAQCLCEVLTLLKDGSAFGQGLQNVGFPRMWAQIGERFGPGYDLGTRSRRCAAWPRVAAPIKITATVSFLTAVKWVVVLNEDLWEQH